LNISGSMLLDGEIRDWQTFLPWVPPSTSFQGTQNAFFIFNFDLHIGN
jgi:hypothetical protein